MVSMLEAGPCGCAVGSKETTTEQFAPGASVFEQVPPPGKPPGKLNPFCNGVIELKPLAGEPPRLFR